MMSGGPVFAALIGRTRVSLPGGVACCCTSGFVNRRGAVRVSRSMPSTPSLASTAAKSFMFDCTSPILGESFVYMRSIYEGRRTFSFSSSRGGAGGDGEDHYATLGLTSSATSKEIKAAFYRLSKQFHPDLNPGDKKAEERFKAVSAAYNVLGDAVKKRDYDREYAASARRTSHSSGDGRWTDGFGSSNRESADWTHMDAERLRREQEVVWRTMREMDAKYRQRRADDLGFGHFEKTARPGSQTPPDQEQRRKREEEARSRFFDDYHRYRRTNYGPNRRFSWRNLTLAEFLIIWFLLGVFLDLLYTLLGPGDLNSPYQGRGPPRG